MVVLIVSTKGTCAALNEKERRGGKGAYGAQTVEATAEANRPAGGGNDAKRAAIIADH